MGRKACAKPRMPEGPRFGGGAFLLRNLGLARRFLWECRGDQCSCPWPPPMERINTGVVVGRPTLMASGKQFQRITVIFQWTMDLPLTQSQRGTLRSHAKDRWGIE